MPIDHLSWPIIPGNNIAAVSALLYQMEHSEVYKSKELFQLQSRQLGKLFKHAVETVPFYNKRFKDAGIDGQEEVTLEALRRLPPLTRVEYQSASDTERKSTAIPVSHGKPSIIKTSGTTGSPVSLYKTPLMGLYWSACYLRNILWQKFDVGKKLAVIRYMEKPKAPIVKTPKRTKTSKKDLK